MARIRGTLTAPQGKPGRQDDPLPRSATRAAARPSATHARRGAGTAGGAPMDHRQGSRCQVMVMARIRWRDNQSAIGLIYDISPDGMFLLSVRGPAPNNCVEVDILSAPGQRGAVSIPGLIVHRSQHGFGVMFRALDGPARAFVKQCLG